MPPARRMSLRHVDRTRGEGWYARTPLSLSIIPTITVEEDSSRDPKVGDRSASHHSGGQAARRTGGGCMPTRDADSIGCDSGRRDGRVGVTVLLALAAVFIPPGCTGPSLLGPSRTILDSRRDRQVIAPSS